MRVLLAIFVVLALIHFCFADDNDVVDTLAEIIPFDEVFPRSLPDCNPAT